MVKFLLFEPIYLLPSQSFPEFPNNFDLFIDIKQNLSERVFEETFGICD